MGQVTLSKTVHDQVSLLSRAWGLTEGGAIERLLEEFQAGGAEDDRPAGIDGVPIHVLYQGSKTEAVFEPTTRRVTVMTGPLAGQSWKSPSGAAVAVVRKANPTIRAERNGWRFWVVTATGATLESLR